MSAVGILPTRGDTRTVDSGHLTILYATESGNSEGVAASAQRAGLALGFQPTVHDMAEITPHDVAGADNLAIIASTAGEGEPPARAVGFLAALLADDAPRFDGTRFSVLALGDRAYPEFCGHGKTLDRRLEELGGTRVADLVECDFDFEQTASEWVRATVPAHLPEHGCPSSAQTAAIATAVEPLSEDRSFVAEIVEHRLLHAPGASAQSAHLSLSTEEAGFAFEPGDVLTVLPVNDPATVDAVLEVLGLATDTALHETLRTGRDITTLSPKLVEAWAAHSGDGRLAKLIADPAAMAAYIAVRQVIDLFRQAPAEIGREELLALLRPLRPRSYSIASSPLVAPGRVDLLVAELRWEADGIRRGVASSDLVFRRRVGDRLVVTHKPNRHFRLPADPSTPIVMIGPGSGIAPFRGFLQHRRAQGASGRNWLFFGHRHSAFDYLYREEWAGMVAEGLLHRMDLAFSRDQPEKTYVQHRLWEGRAELLDWISQGAVIYVCGDRSMGDDVESTIVRLLDEAGRGGELASLKAADRYRTDVY